MVLLGLGLQVPFSQSLTEFQFFSFSRRRLRVLPPPPVLEGLCRQENPHRLAHGDGMLFFFVRRLRVTFFFTFFAPLPIIPLDHFFPSRNSTFPPAQLWAHISAFFPALGPIFLMAPPVSGSRRPPIGIPQNSPSTSKFQDKYTLFAYISAVFFSLRTPYIFLRA